MKIIVLPGYSPHNREWALQTKKELEPDLDIILHEWRHWTVGSFSLNLETESIIKKISQEKINIIAKSVGTRVCMELFSLIPNQIGKVILCGIPMKGMHEESKKYFSSSLLKVDPNKITCFQNKLDPFGSYRIVNKFLKDASPEIKVIEKNRSDHNYPYFDDFKKFFID